MWWTFQTDCIHPPEWVIIECFPLLHILSRPFVIPFFSFFYLSVCGPFSRTKNKRCREFRSRVSFVFASAVRRWMCVLQGQWCVCKSMPQSSVHFSLLLLLFSLSVIFFFFLTTGFSLWTPRRTEPFPPQRFGSHLLYPLRTTVSARALIHRVTSSLMGETTAETKGPKSSPLVKTDKGGIHLSFYYRDSYIGKS